MDTKVCADPTEARRRLDEGDRVVLIVPPDTPAPDLGAGPAHLAYLVGDPEDAATREIARTMAADIWPRPS